jgi:hypothetical protein
MNYSIFVAMAVSLVFITSTSGTFAHVSDQQRYNDGYSLGYKMMWNSLAGETSTQEETQSQAQSGSNVHIDGSHNNVVIAPRQNQEQSSSSSESDSQNIDNTAGNSYT